MSRHRDAVLALAESLAAAAREALTDDVTRQLIHAGLTEARLEPFGPETLTHSGLAQLKRTAEQLIRQAAVEDFRGAEVLIKLTHRERIGRCVAGEIVTSRRFGLAGVQVTAAVRTRWVHPRPAIEFARQWALA